MLLRKFREFYTKNYPQDMEMQIELFSIFGGLDVELDSSLSTEELIKKHILGNYYKIKFDIHNKVGRSQSAHRLLRAFAKGNRKIFSAFNKSGLNNALGGATLAELEKDGVLKIEYSREEAPKKTSKYEKLSRELARYRISHKVLFVSPYVRFWYYFIAPHMRQIQENNFEDFFKDLHKRLPSYTSFVFEELSEILLDYHLRDASILSNGSYWDASLEIDILTIMDSGDIYVAECKWSNHKVTKKELNILLAKCEKLGIAPTQIVLFSKRGFSNELEKQSGKKLALYQASDFELLLKNI